MYNVEFYVKAQCNLSLNLCTVYSVSPLQYLVDHDQIDHILFLLRGIMILNHNS